MNTGFSRITTGSSGGIVNSFLQEKPGIVIFGSSRAVLHYDTRVLSSKLNLPAYNAGCNGQALHYVRGIVDLSLQRNKPLIAIINIDAKEFCDAEKGLSRAMALAPFMGDSDVIRQMIYSRGAFEPLKYASLAYRFNSKSFSIVKNLFAEDQTINGFTPSHAVFDPEKVPAVNPEHLSTKLEVDPTMINLLRNTISQLRDAGVQTVLVHSPRWRENGKIDFYRKPVLQVVRKLAKKEQTPFLAVTLENTPLFQRSDLFKDAAHLNAEGARFFSEILAAKIAGLMENQFQFVCDEL